MWQRKRGQGAGTKWRKCLQHGEARQRVASYQTSKMKNWDWSGVTGKRKKKVNKILW
jgi:hypothetical protein